MKFRDVLGPALWELVRDTGRRLVDVTALTRLPSDRLPRASFRLRFADGTLLKGRRARDASWAERCQTLSHLLDREVFPEILSRRENALLERWIEGRPLPDGPGPIHRCGEILGRLHGVAPPGALVRRRGSVVAGILSHVEDCLARLVQLGALDPTSSRRALELARERAPRDAQAGVVHGDFCAENIVVDPRGRLWVVDNENLDLDPPQLDLARTWYRWPLDPHARREFYTAYGRASDLASFDAHAAFWLVRVLASAARFRIEAGTTDARRPLERLERLLDAPRPEGLPGPG